jgi:hypothetical protein
MNLEVKIWWMKRKMWNVGMSYDEGDAQHESHEDELVQLYQSNLEMLQICPLEYLLLQPVRIVRGLWHVETCFMDVLLQILDHLQLGGEGTSVKRE